MKLETADVDFFVLFVGVARKELECLQDMVHSFLDHYDADLTVMDMSKATARAIADKQILWQQDRAYSYDMVPDITPDDVDDFFNTLPGRVIRHESERYETRCHRTNRLVYEVARKPYVVIVDSDTEFTSGTLIDYVNELCADIDVDRFGAMARIENAMAFNADEKTFGSRKDDPLSQAFHSVDQLQKQLHHARLSSYTGYARQAQIDELNIRQRGMFPRLEPCFLLINRENITRRRILFDMLYLDVIDDIQGCEWRILGDEGSSLLHDLARHRLKLVKCDLSKFLSHKLGSFQAIPKKNVNWFYIGRDIEGAEDDFWDRNEIPADQKYQIPDSQ